MICNFWFSLLVGQKNKRLRKQTWLVMFWKIKILKEKIHLNKSVNNKEKVKSSKFLNFNLNLILKTYHIGTSLKFNLKTACLL